MYKVKTFLKSKNLYAAAENKEWERVHIHIISTVYRVRIHRLK